MIQSGGDGLQPRVRSGLRHSTRQLDLVLEAEAVNMDRSSGFRGLTTWEVSGKWNSRRRRRRQRGLQRSALGRASIACRFAWRASRRQHCISFGPLTANPKLWLRNGLGADGGRPGAQLCIDSTGEGYQDTSVCAPRPFHNQVKPPLLWPTPSSPSSANLSASGQRIRCVSGANRRPNSPGRERRAHWPSLA